MTFALVPSDMTSASAAISDASSEARTAHGADALATLAAALPGSSTAAYMPELGGLWEDGVTGWCDQLDHFRDSIDATSQGGTSADDGVGGLFGRLLGTP
ncbi:hypothetical protein [Nocardioides sp.]|uniref:hypothetical protein n=1 Tax=Nocardioides sp. TaxID=35761 RepID=UPI002BE9A463|nr:hypothetical protein [Nocardioides sp.]HXH80992.1 hypothetical protein [Nocardioides sp.]